MPSFNEKEDKNGKSDEYSSIIRVGLDHQAEIPELTNIPCSKVRECLVWSPEHNLSDSQVEQFIALAKEKHHYSTEQCYALLFINDFDLQQALNDLPLYSATIIGFSKEEKIMFNSLFAQHRKDFTSYLPFLPNRSYQDLVKYYYLNKATLSQHFPKKKKNIRSKDDPEGTDYKKLTVLRIRDRESIICSVCLKTDTEMYKTNTGNLCRQCFENKGPEDNMYSEGDDCGSPKSDHLEELDDFAENIADYNEAGLNNLTLNSQELDRKIREVQVEVMQKKEKINSDFGSPIPSARILPRWSEDDISILPEAIKEYGTDIRKIAQLIGNKSEEQVRTYILAHKDTLLTDTAKEHDLDSSN